MEIYNLTKICFTLAVLFIQICACDGKEQTMMIGNLDNGEKIDSNSPNENDKQTNIELAQYCKTNETNLTKTKVNIIKNRQAIENLTEQVETKHKLELLSNDINNSKELISRNTEAISHIIAMFTIVLGTAAIIATFVTWWLSRESRESREQYKMWLEEREKDFQRKLKRIGDFYENELENQQRFLNLRSLIRKKKYHKDEIYSLLTPLVENPRLTYKPTFHRLFVMNIDPEITKKAKEGLDKLKK